ncbi:MAG: ribonuclease HI [Halanaerobiaceae bacterium]|nr:ribonuclease HI [Halanaerobiaceae bacterium]
MSKNDRDNVIYIYTDGACSGNPGPGGYAALIIDGDQEKEISGYNPETTNNRMEMTAVIEALKYIKDLIKEGCNVKIISDSEYVVKGLQEWLPGWKKRGWKTADRKAVKNQDLWKELDGLVSRFNVEMIKVKGHSGDVYNERVDSLAKKAIENNNKE